LEAVIVFPMYKSGLKHGDSKNAKKVLEIITSNSNHYKYKEPEKI